MKSPETLKRRERVRMNTKAAANERPGLLDWRVWAWAVMVFFMTNPFPYNFTGIDPTAIVRIDQSTLTAVRPQGDNIYLLLRVGITLLALIMVAFNWRRIARNTQFLAPLMAFVVWCGLSSFWSDSPDATTRAVITLLLPLLIGWGLAKTLPSTQAAQALLATGIIVALASVIYALVLPKYGVHQVTDVSQATHAGSWRGVYIHKNSLGQVMAASLIATLFGGRKLIGSFIVWILVMALEFGVMIATTSVGALVIVAIGSTAMLIVYRLSGPVRILAGTALIVGVAAVALSAEYIAALFGRDLSLTGRTGIWAYALDSIGARPIEGYGFSSPTYGGFTRLLIDRIGLNHPHNGYLDLALGVGLVGLLLFVTSLLLAVGRAYVSNSRTAGNGEMIATAALLIGWMISALSESAFRITGPIGGFGMVVLAAALTMDAAARTTARAARRGQGFGARFSGGGDTNATPVTSTELASRIQG